MVRVWLRPALSALSRQALQNGKPVALKAGSQQLLSAQQVLAIRAFSSSKKDKTKALSEKFAAAEEDSIEIPPEVEYLSKESLKDTWKDELDPELIKALQEGDLVLDQSDGDDEDDDVDEIDQLEELLSRDTDEDEFLDDDEDSELTDAEWAAKYERELASIDVDGSREVEDDRLFVEMPVRDRSMMLAADGAVDVEDSDSDDDDDDDDDDNVSESSDPFAAWDQGMAYTPEMMNWMRENKTKTQPFNTRNEKPWKYFVRANHPDVVELAMDVDLLRLFISPTGRIRPRRFTGLTAKQQRRLAQAIKISRQMALLPYLSRYPEPSPEQWRAMEEDEIARLMAAAENEDENDDDDDDELEELEEE